MESGSLRKRRRELERQVQERFGDVRVFTWTMCRKHQQLEVILADGRKARLTTSRTDTQDWRADKNALGALARELRPDGPQSLRK